jgi:L-ascorbate metabolism protein UlaG (beta-lactamase superfamily)
MPPLSPVSPLWITYYGHATLLIEMDGVRLLTDPLLRRRLLHLRRTNPAPEIAQLGQVDAILISHLHRDHLDLPSLARFGRETRLIVPLGAGNLLRKRGFVNITELLPADTISLREVNLLATPARHSGSRPPFGHRAECLGFLVQGSASVYFAGDTDLFPEMADLAKGIDVALVPVWGWGPTLGPGHMDPHRAARSLQLLRPRLAIPIHWGTYYPLGFKLLQASFLTYPPFAFQKYAAELAPQVRVQILPPGGAFWYSSE